MERMEIPTRTTRVRGTAYHVQGVGLQVKTSTGAVAGIHGMYKQLGIKWAALGSPKGIVRR